MKFLKTLGLVSIVGVGVFTIAIATMDFTERGFNYIAEPVGEEGESPEFEITDEMRQEAESQIESVVDEIVTGGNVIRGCGNACIPVFAVDIIGSGIQIDGLFPLILRQVKKQLRQAGVRSCGTNIINLLLLARIASSSAIPLSRCWSFVLVLWYATYFIFSSLLYGFR